jgi:hypothetical protein
MSLYAKINETNIVENIIICEDSQISLINGRHVKVTELTGNASIGFEYSSDHNKFIAIKPFDSWVLDNDLFAWKAPVALPEDANVTPLGSVINYRWNEEDQEWVAVVSAPAE